MKTVKRKKERKKEARQKNSFKPRDKFKGTVSQNVYSYFILFKIK